MPSSSCFMGFGTCSKGGQRSQINFLINGFMRHVAIIFLKTVVIRGYTNWNSLRKATRLRIFSDQVSRFSFPIPKLRIATDVASRMTLIHRRVAQSFRARRRYLDSAQNNYVTLLRIIVGGPSDPLSASSFGIERRKRETYPWISRCPMDLHSSFNLVQPTKLTTFKKKNCGKARNFWWMWKQDFWHLEI